VHDGLGSLEQDAGAPAVHDTQEHRAVLSEGGGGHRVHALTFCTGFDPCGPCGVGAIFFGT